MNPFDLPEALLAFLAFVAVTPALTFFVTSHPNLAGMGVESRLLVGFAVPMFVLLFLASWVAAGG